MRIVLAGMVAVAAAFAVVLGLGFWIHERTSAIPDTLFGWLAALAIPLIAGWIMCLLLGFSPWRYRLPHQGRLYTAPPALGQFRAAAQRAYAENPNATEACAHLRPIEHAMRRAGVKLSLLDVHEYAPVVMAECRINVPELNRVFHLPAWIYYQEGFQPERSPYDNPRADIFCEQCLKTSHMRAIVSVPHPAEWRADTPWFPSSP